MSQVLTRSKTSTTSLLEKVKALELENINLLVQVKSLTTEINKLQRPDPKVLNDKWLEDIHLDAYFNGIYCDILSQNTNISLIGPSLTQILKSGDEFDVIQTLADTSFYKTNIAFFCVSNCLNNEYTRYKDPTLQLSARSSHWSLLICNKHEQKFYHIDSIRGLNHSNAKMLAKNINSDYFFEEISSVQQTSNFECGLHVLVNMKYILDHILKTNSMPLNQLIKNLTQSGRNNTTYITRKVKEDENVISNSFNFDTLSKRPVNKVINKTPYCIPTKQTQNNLTKQSEKEFKIVKHKHITHGKTSKAEEFVIKCFNKFSSLQEECNETENSSYNENYNFNLEEVNETSNNQSFVKNNSDICQIYHQSLSNSSGIYKTLETNLNESILLEQEVSRPTHNLLKCTKDLSDKISNVSLNEEKQKIKILSDSHGRHVSKMLVDKIGDNFKIEGTVKPNGKLYDVIKLNDEERMNLNNDDFVIIIAGTNDIDEPSKYSVQKYCSELKENISKLKHTNVILSAIPYRFDKPLCNRYIKHVNMFIQKLALNYLHVHYLSLQDICRSHYTKHGLHLNMSGKKVYALAIINLISHISLGQSHMIPIPIQTTTRKPLIPVYSKHTFLGIGTYAMNGT